MTDEKQAEELVKENVCKKCGSKVCGFLIHKCDIALPRYEGVLIGLKTNAERIKQLEKENKDNCIDCEYVNLIIDKDNQISRLEKEIEEQKEELKICQSVASEIINKMKNCGNCKYFNHKLLNRGNIRICKINPNDIYDVCDIWKLAE